MRHSLVKWILFVSASFLLTACLMPIEGKHSERQMRMIRCEQYTELDREACMNGEAVTVKEYKEDLQDYKDEIEKDKKREEIQ